ncbi:unnamed protein product [Caenorhabditis sp. 36 PRJEB53466]|nr:unnamed protein product [Caenorhabditis sp. 36 PRJEB53466]
MMSYHLAIATRAGNALKQFSTETKEELKPLEGVSNAELLLKKDWFVERLDIIESKMERLERSMSELTTAAENEEIAEKSWTDGQLRRIRSEESTSRHRSSMLKEEIRVSGHQIRNNITVPTFNGNKGEPLELLYRFEVSEENYDDAIKLLKAKYSDRESIVLELNDRLKNEKALDSSIKEQRRLMERMIITITQLKRHGENLDNRYLMDFLLGKFSQSIRKETYRSKIQANKDWTMAQMFEDLEQVIKIEEDLRVCMGPGEESEKTTIEQGQSTFQEPNPNNAFGGGVRQNQDPG